MRISSIFFILAFLNILVLPAESKPDEPVAVNGIFDLRGIKDPDHFLVKLNGEWEFYWNEMLNPVDFKTPGIKPPYFGKVPSYWTDYPQDQVKTMKFGYATYRLVVLLPKGFSGSVGIDIPVFDSSYEIYLDDKFMDGNGKPGKSPEETTPGYNRNILTYTPHSDSLQIIINVANFDHRRGGFWLPLHFGTQQEVMKEFADIRSGEWAIMSVLLGFSIFFLIFFITSPGDKIMGFFSVSGIGLALRPLFTSHYIINSLVTIPWIWIVRCEYIGLYLIIIGWVWFNSSLYPSKYFRIFALTLTAFFLTALVLTLFLPVKIFSYIMQVYYPSMIILIAYGLFSSLHGALRKKIIDIIYFLAFVLLGFAGIHDIMIALGKSVAIPGYLLSYFIVLFVFIQSGMLLYKWVSDYNLRKRLQGELEFLNKNLEKIVDERTQELQSRNEEIQNQNVKIAVQNKKLTDTIQLKNKVFSVIAHDLRGPVVNILYLLNLLKEKEYEEEREAFTDYSITYAQNVVSLLENMLVWGRGQESMIKYSPIRYDLTDIIMKNLSIYKEIADKKEISVNFSREGNLLALIDKDLLDIIIRNLMSNAVKYTPRGGKISIQLTDDVPGSERVIFKICDTGVGISEERQRKLFTSVEIETTHGTEDEAGTGLGLKLCHELVIVNKGTISVESTVGEGSCFVINLPAVL
jgi:signal transduction histidine kinase